MLNYELGAKTQLADGRVTFNAAVFYSDIDDLQVIADAGSCSSRIVLNAQAESIGAEVELFARPNDELGLRPVRDVGAGRDHRDADGRRPARRSRASATAIACRPRRSSRPSASVDLQLAVLGDAGSVRELHVPARRLVVHAARRSGAGVRLRRLSRARRASSPSAIRRSTASRSIRSCRRTRSATCASACRSDAWEAALFVNNVWDERAFLSLDRERGIARARRLSDEHAAHVWRVAAHELLSDAICFSRVRASPSPARAAGRVSSRLCRAHFADEVPSHGAVPLCVSCRLLAHRCR